MLLAPVPLQSVTAPYITTAPHNTLMMLHPPTSSYNSPQSSTQPSSTVHNQSPYQLVSVMNDSRVDAAIVDSTSHTYTTATAKKSRSTHTWHLKGFTHLPRSSNKPVVTTFQCGAIEWELRLFAFGENDDDQLSLFLHLKNSGTQPQVTCKFQFKLLSTDEQHYCKGTNGRSFTFNKHKSAFGCPLLIHRHTLLNNQYLLHDDTLIIVTELEMSTDLHIIDGTIQSPTTLTNNNTQQHLLQLSKDMNNCINTRTDLYLLPKAVHSPSCNTISIPFDSLDIDDAHTDAIPVHRVILCARSPVFNAMLSKQFIESDQNTIVLHGINKFTLHKLIEYIYTGTLQPCTDMQWKHYVELYEAAVQYGVELLTELCAYHIAIYIDKSNILQTLQLAESYKNVTGASIIKHACKTRLVQEFDDYISVLSTSVIINNCAQNSNDNMNNVPPCKSDNNLVQPCCISNNDVFAPTPDSKKRRLITEHGIGTQ